VTDPTFSDWFCLVQGRKNFLIDPQRDQEHLFGEAAWEDEVDSRLRRSQLLGTPVRLVWWGQFGIGKTHRLRHTEYLVRTKGYRYYPRYLVASDIQEKTGFERLHYELVNSIGRDSAEKMVAAYILRLANKEEGIVELERICNGVSDVVHAFRSFGSGNANTSLPAWRYLCGLKLKGAEATLANVTKEQADSSNEFAAIIGALAHIIQVEQEGRELLYLIDEVENLQRITNKTAAARWQESLRSILDIQNLSMVFTIGAERQEGIPAIILQPDIVRRVQRDNYLEMAAYKPPTARKFVQGLLGRWIDAERRAALEQEEDLAGKFPGYDPAYYPFTKGGFEKFCDWSVIDPRTAKPSEILSRLNNITAEALFRKERLITKDLLTDLGVN
jgi:hypothetical protein